MSNLEDFYLEEYKKISDAHFNVSHRITSFFQYMLAIYAAPLILFNVDINIGVELKGYVFLFIAVIGFFVCMYANQLRCESLLYAHTVNGMRSYFYDTYASFDDKQNRYMVLPIQSKKPPYIDTHQFSWIVYTSVLINAGYLIYGISQLKDSIRGLYIGLMDYSGSSEIIKNSNEGYILLAIFLMVIFIQYIVYRLLTRRVESGCTLFKHRIGIDIDGVQNEHEQQFCNIYNELFSKELMADQITEIPVHKIADAGVSEKEERVVFNKKKYWEEMPAKDELAEYLSKIQNILGLEAYVFTWRPWGIGEEEGHDKFDIEQITRDWLKKCGIKYKDIFFEKGNYNAPINMRKAIFKNRFYYAHKYKLKYFVEDDLPKAIKMASICQYVFLMDHAYNKAELPFNVIRVSGWAEIYDKLKAL